MCAVCDLVSSDGGVVAIIGLRALHLSESLAGYLRAVQVPFLTTSALRTGIARERNGAAEAEPFEVQLRPYITGAVIELVNVYKWDHLIYMYDSDEGACLRVLRYCAMVLYTLNPCFKTISGGDLLAACLRRHVPRAAARRVLQTEAPEALGAHTSLLRPEQHAGGSPAHQKPAAGHRKCCRYIVHTSGFSSPIYSTTYVTSLSHMEFNTSLLYYCKYTCDK